MEEISIYHLILASAYAFGWTQWLAFGFSLAYVVLAAKESIWCWPFGLVGVVLAGMVYVEYRLYSEAVLQVYYAAVSIYGWWAWRNTDEPTRNIALDEEEEEELKISRWPLRTHLIAGVIGIVVALMWGYFWSHFGAQLPYIDSTIALFSVIATYMVAKKILENWIYWIIIDFVCIFVYLERGMYLFAILFLIYCIVAIFGYLSWRREYELDLASE